MHLLLRHICTRTPGRTPAEPEQRIVRVRDAHPAWGSRKIMHSLKRAGVSPPAASTVHAVLIGDGRE
jgi:hypothetical protein